MVIEVVKEELGRTSILKKRKVWNNIKSKIILDNRRNTGFVLYR